MEPTEPEAKHLAGESTKPLLSDKTYNAVKWIAQYLLPALGTLYFALATLWGLPNPEQVIGTITALDIFLGALLGFSKKSYEKSDAKYDGALVVDDTDPDKDIYRLEVDSHLDELNGRDAITLKVLGPNHP